MKLLFKSFMVPFSVLCIVSVCALLGIFMAEHPEYHRIFVITFFSVLFIVSWIVAYLIMREKY